MNLLIVEDDENTIAMFEEEFPPGGPCVAAFARSKDSAEAFLSAQIFDFIVLDLKIPTQDRNLDADMSHGLAVHALIQKSAPGTPILVFSAFGTFQLASTLAERSPRLDVWGTGQEQQMTICREKADLTTCLKNINDAFAHVAALSSIPISTGGQDLGLTEQQTRTLRIFARRYHGTNIRVSALGGGLSAARTVRAEVFDHDNQMTSIAVAKLGAISDLQDELSRYDEFIKPALSVGCFAHFISFVCAGGGPFGGLFYGFGTTYNNSLLGLLASKPADAAKTVPVLRSMEAPWQKNTKTTTVTIKEIRKRMISDADFLPVADQLGFDWNALENLTVQVSWCCQHCDMHGLNVLVDGDKPLLIDYGMVEVAPVCLDALILELSLLFHPACATIRGAWPSIDQCTKWFDRDAFVSGTPLAPFILACRQWAFEVEPVDRAVYATVYSFAVRQLKFEGDRQLPCAIANAANTILTRA
jgi:CheY-like chemotaxis protein